MKHAVLATDVGTGQEETTCSKICCTPPDTLQLRKKNSCLNVTCLEKAKHPLLPRICYCLWGLLGHCRSAESCCPPSTLACTTAAPSPSSSEGAPLLSTQWPIPLPTLTAKNNLIQELSLVRP